VEMAHGTTKVEVDEVIGEVPSISLIRHSFRIEESSRLS
jgi:hypothetical protein